MTLLNYPTQAPKISDSKHLKIVVESGDLWPLTTITQSRDCSQDFIVPIQLLTRWLEKSSHSISLMKFLALTQNATKSQTRELANLLDTCDFTVLQRIWYQVIAIKQQKEKKEYIRSLDPFIYVSYFLDEEEKKEVE